MKIYRVITFWAFLVYLKSSRRVVEELQKYHLLI